MHAVDHFSLERVKIERKKEAIRLRTIRMLATPASREAAMI
jgi:hypothetical protein